MRSDAPAGKFVQVSAVGDASCGLRTDGRPLCWGYWMISGMRPRGGEFVSVSAAGVLGRPCGVRTDGRVECWGYGTPGEPPAAAAPLVSASVGPRSSTHGRDDQTPTS